MSLLPKNISKVKVPPIKIQGIKTKLVPFIASSIKWDGRGTYVEPFMGSGVVGFNLAPERAVFSDTNPHIINFYSSVQRGEVTAQLVRQYLEEESPKLTATPEDKNSYFYEVRDRFNFALASFEETLQGLTSDNFIYMDPPYIGRYDGYYDSWSEEKANLLRSVIEKSDAGYALSMWDENKYRRNEHLDTWGSNIKLTQEHLYHVGARESNRASMTEALMVSPNCLATYSPQP